MDVNRQSTEAFQYAEESCSSPAVRVISRNSGFEFNRNQWPIILDCLNNGLVWGIVACYLGLLGSPGIGTFMLLQHA